MRERNDLRQYDDLADEWWDLDGPFASLHWIAEARGALVPPAPQPDALLIDLACGAGLLAPFVRSKGYRHIGLDWTMSALAHAQLHGLTVARADVGSIPFADDVADVVCLGEILEHVTDVDPVITEACRVLRPGGLMIIDTIADTRRARLVAISLAERIRGLAPKGIHHHQLFVNRTVLVRRFAEHGIQLQLRGLRPSLRSYVRWRVGRRATGRMVPTRSTRVLFQAWGRKHPRATIEQEGPYDRR